MKLYQFDEWKDLTNRYWMDKVVHGVNGLYGTPASGTDGGHYRNQPALTTQIKNSLNTVTSNFLTYRGSGSIYNATMNTFASLMGFVSLHDVVTTPYGPPSTLVPTMLTTTKDWYGIFTVDLPDYTTYFQLDNEIISISVTAGIPYTSNQQLIDAGLWYTGTGPWPSAPPSDTDYTLVSGNGVFTADGTDLLSSSVTALAKADTDAINLWISNVQTNYARDAIIYRMFAEPFLLTSPKKPKDWILEDYHFQEVLDAFHWTIPGFN